MGLNGEIDAKLRLRDANRRAAAERLRQLISDHFMRSGPPSGSFKSTCKMVTRRDSSAEIASVTQVAASICLRSTFDPVGNGNENALSGAR